MGWLALLYLLPPCLSPSISPPVIIMLHLLFKRNNVRSWSRIEEGQTWICLWKSDTPKVESKRVCRCSSQSPVLRTLMVHVSFLECPFFLIFLGNSSFMFQDSVQGHLLCQVFPDALPSSCSHPVKHAVHTFNVELIIICCDCCFFTCLFYGSVSSLRKRPWFNYDLIMYIDVAWNTRPRT
jgi:hypothetical protein